VTGETETGGGSVATNERDRNCRGGVENDGIKGTMKGGANNRGGSRVPKSSIQRGHRGIKTATAGRDIWTKRGVGEDKRGRWPNEGDG